MKAEWTKEMADVVGENKLLLDEASLEKYSKDYYWYSPILDSKLKNKKADGIVRVSSEEEVVQVLSFAYRRKIPVTVRGAGTGNYGQAVPLEGGIVLDVSGLDKIIELGEGYARLQCGVKMGVLEKKARKQNQELRIYPSTFVKATIGGFVSGGSGGIGSITWGNLWNGNVLEAVVYTLEEQPRRLVVQGEELADYIHNYGTTGIMTELLIPLSTKTEWLQSVISFDSLKASLLFADAIANTDEIRKRLVAPMEWPIPSFFTPLIKHLEQDAHAVLLETEDGTLSVLSALAQSFGGRVSYVIAADQYHEVLGLSDFTWNHTTLWALKTDSTFTYLQSGFSPESFLEQATKIKKQYGDEVLLHFEWTRGRGKVVPIALPIVKYTTEQRLYEIIGFCKSIGVSINDPHIWTLEGGAGGEMNGMQRKKLDNDPLGLLNPGKIEMRE